MVLAVLGEFIYHCYMLIFNIIQIATVIGYWLYCGICKVASLLQNISVFTKIVIEDNYHHIQDAKTIIAGTSDFFISNAGKACIAVCTIGGVFRDAVVACFNAVCLTVWSIKRSLILIGEAVWLLFTSPYQLMVLLDELLHYCVKQSLGLAQRTSKFCVQAVVDFVHYTTHDVPLEATAGLIILGLICLHPGPAISVSRFVIRAVCFSFRFLCAKARNCLIALFARLSRLGHVVYFRFLLPFGHFLGYILIAMSHSLGFNEIYNQFARAYRYTMRLSYRRPLPASTATAAPATPPPPPEPLPVRRTTPQSNKLGSCIICEDDDRTIAFVPCGHLCVCRVCAQNISYYNPVCPVCRKRIEKQLKVYL